MNSSNISYKSSKRQKSLTQKQKSLNLGTLRINRLTAKSKKKKSNQKYILSNLDFKKADLIGEGTFSEVYKFRYKGKLDKKYVVKKIKVAFLRPYYSDNKRLANYEILNSFIEELNAMIELSIVGITPKIYGKYLDIENDRLYYVLQKLDYTFGHIVREKKFKIEMTTDILNLLISLMKTKYRHVDLHIDNMMYNQSDNKFYLIDFGKQKVLKSKNSEDLYYTMKSNKDHVLFDFTKKLENSIIGSSGYSVIAVLYLLLYNDTSQKAAMYLNKLKLFIQKYVPKSKYQEVLDTLEKQDYAKLL